MKEEKEIQRLRNLCGRLAAALEIANDSDACAEGYNSANFSEKREEFENLIAEGLNE
jgi:hypothetical protein